MKRVLPFAPLIFLLFSCSSQPSVRSETVLLFYFNGPQGVTTKLYYKDQLIDTIEPGEIIEKKIPNTDYNIILKAQIGNASKYFPLTIHNSDTIKSNLSAKRNPSGVVITDFGIVDRIPLYKVKYVAVDGLHVRNGEGVSNNSIDIIPEDCRVEILGEYMSGWDRIKYYGSKFGFVNSKYLHSSPPLFSITAIRLGNATYEARWLAPPGSDLYSSEMRYLMPVLFYESYNTLTMEFFYKVFDQTGFLVCSSTPFEYQIYSGKDQIARLRGWGNNTKSIYQAGEYNIEIWNKNKRLWVEKFSVLP